MSAAAGSCLGGGTCTGGGGGTRRPQSVRCCYNEKGGEGVLVVEARRGHFSLSDKLCSYSAINSTPVDSLPCSPTLSLSHPHTHPQNTNAESFSSTTPHLPRFPAILLLSEEEKCFNRSVSV